MADINKARIGDIILNGNTKYKLEGLYIVEIESNWLPKCVVQKNNNILAVANRSTPHQSLNSWYKDIDEVICNKNDVPEKEFLKLIEMLESSDLDTVRYALEICKSYKK